MRSLYCVMVVFATLVATDSIEQLNGNGDGSFDGSNQASTRLMKELMETYKSESYKKGVFEVELVNDNLYEWDVKLLFPDSELLLHKDMALLKEQGKPSYVQLRITFPQNYPNEPPFARVIYPVIWGLDTGHLCMFLLSPQGWLPDCTMEGLILSIIDRLVIYGHRVNLKPDEDRQAGYTEEMARKERAMTLRFHGWGKPKEKDQP